MAHTHTIDERFEILMTNHLPLLSVPHRQPSSRQTFATSGGVPYKGQQRCSEEHLYHGDGKTLLAVQLSARLCAKYHKSSASADGQARLVLVQT
jgi:hypothetical protein